LIAIKNAYNSNGPNGNETCGKIIGKINNYLLPHWLVASDFAMKKQKREYVIMTGPRPSEMRPKTNYDEAKAQVKASNGLPISCNCA
jgi:hypothetical protein